ncbi:hypothetical protein L202_06795 [Cryptococcus amylolentus CBS 6039]|uniref:Homeobox domain-containing protein n=1 Tax=Cryptococcus amylolentus CBS 6039 TaxID=1295533 RepID=A0A1E3HDI1_9TREE|nr:hypothetical protein L202_06795 [Cryptococcus amylolentus CBS 6039]ODN74384.1 hypothetical protein L202_06795 [Cryptococcus amylolentus CBS 6039]
MDSDSYLEGWAATADQIIADCSSGGSIPSKPITTSGLQPKIAIPDLGSISNKANLSWLSPRLQQTVYQRISVTLQYLGDKMLKTFRSTTSGLLSQELLGGLSDKEIELWVAQVFEQYYRRESDRFLNRVADMDALNTLEAAYERCPVLSPAETNLVASAAGITPQQVRTWFQNKRNRGKKLGGGKPAKPSSGPRLVASLPKRVPRQPSCSYSASPEPLNTINDTPTRRPVRDLPRRAHTQRRTSFDPSTEITPEPSLVDGDSNSVFSPATLSPGSSCGSIASNGGFISPFSMHMAQQQGQEGGRQETQINICWDQGVLNVPFEALKSSEGVPNFEFVPPTPSQNNWGSFDAIIPDALSFPGNFGMDDLSQMSYGGQFDDASLGLDSIEHILNEALSDPTAFGGLTLSGSPQFSESSPLTPGSEAGASEVSSTTFVSNGVKGGDGLDGDFFSVLDGMISAPSPVGEHTYPIFSPQDRSVSSASSSSALSFTSASTAPTSVSSSSVLEQENQYQHNQYTKGLDLFVPVQHQHQPRQGSGSFDVGSVGNEIGHAWQGQGDFGAQPQQGQKQEASSWGWTSGLLPFDSTPSPSDEHTSNPPFFSFPNSPNTPPFSQHTPTPSRLNSGESQASLFAPMGQAAAYGFNPTMPVGQSYGASGRGQGL